MTRTSRAGPAACAALASSDAANTATHAEAQRRPGALFALSPPRAAVPVPMPIALLCPRIDQNRVPKSSAAV